MMMIVTKGRPLTYRNGSNVHRRSIRVPLKVTLIIMTFASLLLLLLLFGRWDVEVGTVTTVTGTVTTTRNTTVTVMMRGWVLGWRRVVVIVVVVVVVFSRRGGGSRDCFQ